MDTHGRILIVEDEEKIARFLELELTHEGYEVGKAADGRCALDMALASTWDLILLDVMLPQLNGLEVLRRVRRESDVPVILLTARDAVMDKVSGLDAGANDYITKPFAIEELLARIRVSGSLVCACRRRLLGVWFGLSVHHGCRQGRFACRSSNARPLAQARARGRDPRRAHHARV